MPRPTMGPQTKPYGVGGEHGMAWTSILHQIVTRQCSLTFCGLGSQEASTLTIAYESKTNTLWWHWGPHDSGHASLTQPYIRHHDDI